MKAEEAKLGQFVQVNAVGQIARIEGDSVSVQFDHPIYKDMKLTCFRLPWSAVEPMAEAELRALDDPTIINGA